MTHRSAIRSRVAACWTELGQTAYEEALAVQQARVEALLAEVDERQVVYAVEHPPTITIGRNGSEENILLPRDRLAQMGISVFAVDRGGDVTYHGPGQVVVYPILHLGPWGNDVGWYVRSLEESVILALRTEGIQGERREGYPGVWVGDEKICAVGARVRRRKSGEFVTSHGLALNVTTDLSHFGVIVPCGIRDKGVTSVAQVTGRAADWHDWAGRLRTAMAEVFGFAWETS
ncbi:octanoyltransferase [Alicyclobacillus cellulosilyticus]|uniref:Octanoyltransferase n=1 Tax=Alicyclobacillus cellulosilyticus TaxID=1003997 RepID=A0A917K141_9BACL|nr:lipoyl(octanoyl) transferase LipB [Alicyclobacillus cellulosilyticus]GGI95650.1 octanoyltransferase [Alicyclobacillus cellulosilyticus]